MTRHSTKVVLHPFCKGCGTTTNLKKDSRAVSGFRSLCYTCDGKRQRIRVNGHDTGSLKDRPIICKDCGESDITKLCPSKNLTAGVLKRCRYCAAKRMQEQRKKPNSKHLENHRRTNLRKRVLAYYGNKCSYCSEWRYEFLAIDHINDDGYLDRKKMDNDSLISKIVKENFPKDRYQILCHNCNSAKSYYKCSPILREKDQKAITEGFMGEGI